MFFEAIQSVLAFAHLILPISALFVVFIEVGIYLQISKFKFPETTKAYGHAFTFLVQFIAFSLAFFTLAFTYVFAWKVAGFFNNGFLQFGALILVMLVGGLIVGAFALIGTEFLDDHSEAAKLLNKANKQLSKGGDLLNSNDKAPIIKRQKEVYWNDFRHNFWKFRIMKKK